MNQHLLRFEKKELQDRLISELQRKNIPFQLTQDNAVICSEEQWGNVNGTAHVIRDSCFRWYFSWFESADAISLFYKLLLKSGLPFELEHHETGYVFLLSKDHTEGYDKLLESFADEDVDA